MYYLFAFCLFVFCRIALFSLIITQNPTTLYSAKNLSPRGTPRRLCIVRQSFPTFRTWIPTKTSFPDPLSFPSPGESRRDRCGKVCRVRWTESRLYASYAARKLRSRRCTLLWAYFIFISITDINECDGGVHDCLRSLASCKNTLGSFNCSCNHGYIGDGKTYCTEAPGKIIDNFTLFAFCFTEVAIGFVFL